jgi:hypothetical protein
VRFSHTGFLFFFPPLCVPFAVSDSVLVFVGASGPRNHFGFINGFDFAPFVCRRAFAAPAADSEG